MDISTKKWRVRSGATGHREITNKATGEMRYVLAGDVPNLHMLSMAKESDFDRMIARVFG